MSLVRTRDITTHGWNLLDYRILRKASRLARSLRLTPCNKCHRTGKKRIERKGKSVKTRYYIIHCNWCSTEITRIGNDSNSRY